MYKIIKDGGSIGMTEAPIFIKQTENGCYVLCPEPEASGIAFAGEVYHLLDREPLEGVETVMLEEFDVGEMIALEQKASRDADSMTVDHEYRLTMIELGQMDNENI